MTSWDSVSSPVTQAKTPSPWDSVSTPVADPENLIDRSSGAPIKVRAAVGAAETPQDRLSTIRTFYPDAQPYKGDNFVFKNPKTGQPTLYNEQNSTILPSIGDVVSAGPEIAEYLGGTIGGIGGTIAAPFTGPAAPAIPYVGMGIGAAGARQGYSALADALLGTQDTRSGTEKTADATITAATNAVGGKIGDKVLDAAKGMFGLRQVIAGKTKPETKALLATAQKTGVDLPAAAVTGNRNTTMIENALMNIPGGADVMAAKYGNAESQLADRSKALARALSGDEPVSTQGAGQTIKDSATKAAERFKDRRAGLDATATALIGSDRAIQPTNVETLGLDFAETAAKKAQAADVSRAMQEAKNIVADAKAGKLGYEDLRKIRTRIGRELDNPNAAQYTPADQANMRKLYGAINQDLYGAAKQAGPAAEKALATHDRYVSLNRTINMPVLDKVIGQGTDEQAFKFAMQGAKDGSSRLDSLRRNFKPEEWDTVAGTIFDNLGRAKPSAQGAGDLFDAAGDWSADTFLTNWNSMSPQARKAAFGGTRYDALQEPMSALVKSTGALKQAMKGRNFSNTAPNLIPALAMYSAIGGLAGGVASGDPGSGVKTGVGTAVGAVLAPRLAAKLLTNPKTVRWLAEAPAAAAKNSWVSHLGRLTAIGTADPDMRESIDALLNATQGTQPSGADKTPKPAR